MKNIEDENLVEIIETITAIALSRLTLVHLICENLTAVLYQATQHN